MDYFKGVVKAIVPRKPKDILAVTLLCSAFVYVGWKTFLVEAPAVSVRTETTYPKEAYRNGFFYMNFDVAFGDTCLINARRVIIGSDGVEYLVQEDSKEVVKDVPIRYVVRIPVLPSIPLGPAFIRSDFQYACDWWSRHIQYITRQGRMRPVMILPERSS